MKPMKGRDRNAPCWCRSGKKFKKCHLDRESQKKENFWTPLEVNRKAFQNKRCFAYGAGLGPCEGGIIKAHTVSRGRNLKSIAKDGHVFQYRASIQSFRKNGEKIQPEKIGINDASAFYGFCAYHDRVIFSCIENEAFAGRSDQCLAIFYRTICREAYGKDASSHLRETLRDADKGSPLEYQIALQIALDSINLGNEASRREISTTRNLLASALANNDYDFISSIILIFEEHLPFMFSGAWSPLTDLFNKNLQDGAIDHLLEQVCFSSFSGDIGDLICISWRAVDNAPGAVIADQILELPNYQQGSACFQIVLKHIENIFFNPEWFDALPNEQRSLIDRLAMDGVNFLGTVPSESIVPSVTFDLPRVVNIVKL